jgi:hypothetical protein
LTYFTTRYERSKLYEEIWAEPVTAVSRRYGISDVALRKICQKLAVPLPPRGYWARIEAGRHPRRPALPKHSGRTEIVRQRYVSEHPAEADPGHLIARREFEARPENRIIVQETLERALPVVAAMARGSRTISVSQGCLPRARRVLDALARALELRHMPLRVDRTGEKGAYVTIQEQVLSIRLVEKTVRTERDLTVKEQREWKEFGYTYIPNRYAYTPTGALMLGVACSTGDLRRKISDGKQQRIEEHLNRFVVGLEAEAVERVREAQRLEEQHRRWAEEERIRREQERLLQEEVQQWRRAEEIRAYVSAVEVKAASSVTAVDSSSEVGRWIGWARSKADSLDPLVGAESSAGRASNQGALD